MFSANLLKGSFLRRLISLFFFFGIIPAIILTVISASYLFKQNNQITEELGNQLKTQTEIELINTVENHAMQYDEDFQEKSKVAVQIANYLTIMLEDPINQSQLDQWDFETATEYHPSGWRINQEDDAIGFKLSPLAKVNEDLIARQNAIAEVQPLLQSIYASDPTIRTIFIISEDQTGWIYPNRFWDNGSFIEGVDPDFKNRAYYQITKDPIWSNPYLDIEPDITVITVAAPIWANDKFSGIVGIDFSIDTFLEDVLQTEIGDDGFMFLIGENNEIIALPDSAMGWLVPSELDNNLEDYLNSNLSDVVSNEIKNAFIDTDLISKLKEKSSFIFNIELENGPSYFAVAPIETMGWNVAVVLPVSEVTVFANQVSELMRQNASTIMHLLFFTGFGFFTVILIGGFFNLRQLAIPIQDLAKGADEISGGNLSHRVSQDLGPNEMTSLSKNFNIMAESIQSMQNDIESRRKSLKKTLQEKELEFDSINKMAEVANRQISLSETIDCAIENANDALNAILLVVSLVDAQNHWTIIKINGTEDQSQQTKALFANSLFRELWFNSIRQRGLLIDLEQNTENDLIEDVCRDLLSLGGKKILFEPIFSKGKPLGILTMLFASKETISPQKLSYIDAVTKHLSVLIENVRLQSQARDLIIIEERRRLAREMHDSVTQSLFTIRLTAEGLNSSCIDDDQTNKQALEMLIDQIDFVQKEMRALIQELIPLDSQSEDIHQILQSRASSFQRISGIEVNLQIAGETRQLNSIIKQNINRIAQEALSNVVKHSHAHHVTIQLENQQKIVTLTIIDDGDGFLIEETLRQEGTSLGLLSMRERAESLGGVLQVRSQLGKGTTIVAKIPISTEETSNGK